MNIFSNPENYAYLICALPGLAFFVILIGLLLARKLFMKLGPYVSIFAIGGAAAIATLIFIKMVTGGYEAQHNFVRPWSYDYQTIGNLKIHLGIALDGLAVFVVFMVTVVACLIQIYSTAYMHGDKHYGRYFAFHSLFVFSMLTMVLSDNLLSFYIGWELMGLCSYLLIGFFYYKHSAADAQKKAFLVTKLGDIFMFIGIMVLGWLVLRVGVEKPYTDANSQANGPKSIVERYDFDSISFVFTDQAYEQIYSLDNEIKALGGEHGGGHAGSAEAGGPDKIALEEKKATLLAEYHDRNKPVEQYYKNIIGVIGFGEKFKRDILKKYLARDKFVDNFWPYIIMVLTDPNLSTYDEANKKMVNIKPGTDEWKAFCESLKSNPVYLAKIQDWFEFTNKNASEVALAKWESWRKDNLSGFDIWTSRYKGDTYANWGAFCDEMKYVRPHAFSAKGLETIKHSLDEAKTKYERDVAQVQNNEPGDEINLLIPDTISYFETIINGFDKKDEKGKKKDDPDKQKLDDTMALVKNLGFMDPGEAAVLAKLFDAQAKKYLTGDGVIADASYAGSFRKFGEIFGSYADKSRTAKLADFSSLKREIANEQAKYSVRTMPIKEVITGYNWGAIAGEGEDGEKKKDYTWLLTLAALLLFGGAIGKSAQVPLHVWLPDAMEGPTPVSALIHAATMVAAGVYMVGRFYFLFAAAPGALAVVAYIGAITAFFAATIGVTQYDIKRVLAYSTISQLGYMMIGLGVGSLTAGIFHLICHAYFKALLFLGSGSVIHGSGTQDMREMGGLAKKMKWTYITFMAGTLALCGIFPFAGFWSKDEVLGAAFFWAKSTNPLNFVVFLLGIGGALLTAFYMFRLISMTFYGKYRGHHHVHESPPSMLVPLMILAVFATFYGLLGTPFSEKMNVFGKFVNFPGGHHPFSIMTALLMLVSLGIAVAGVYAGIKLGGWQSPFKENLKAKYPVLYRWVYNKYYFDEFYNGVIVVGVLFLCRVMRIIDTYIIDGVVNAAAWVMTKLSWLHGRIDLFVVDGAVNLVGWVVDNVSRMVRPLQSGYAQNTMLATVIFILAVLLYSFIK